MTPQPRNPISAWIAAGLVFMLTSCTHRPGVRDTAVLQLPLGLYQVVERQCSYAADVPEDCSRTRFIEFAKGVFRSLDKDDIGMATWLSADPEREHYFNIRDLRQGKFVSDHEYVIEDGPLGKEWLTVRSGTITDYFFVRRARKTPVGDMAGETHFVLQRVARTDKLNRLLHYPADDE
jgi:hypothetical protein